MLKQWYKIDKFNLILKFLNIFLISLISQQMPEIIELEKHWTSISDKLAKLQVEISAARVPAKSAHASSLVTLFYFNSSQNG